MVDTSRAIICDRPRQRDCPPPPGYRFFRNQHTRDDSTPPRGRNANAPDENIARGAGDTEMVLPTAKVRAAHVERAASWLAKGFSAQHQVHVNNRFRSPTRISGSPRREDVSSPTITSPTYKLSSTWRGGAMSVPLLPQSHTGLASEGFSIINAKKGRATSASRARCKDKVAPATVEEQPCSLPSLNRRDVQSSSTGSLPRVVPKAAKRRRAGRRVRSDTHVRARRRQTIDAEELAKRIGEEERRRYVAGFRLGSSNGCRWRSGFAAASASVPADSEGRTLRAHPYILSRIRSLPNL